MILLTGFYHDAETSRRGELLECLRRNVALERLDEIQVFIEDAMAAEECLLDVLLMAKRQHLVHSNSSVTNGVLVFNPRMSHDALHRRPESERAA